MNKKETAGIMAILETAYPNYYAKRSDQQRLEALALWAEMFREDSVDLVGAAVKTIICGSVSAFPPSIGEIKGKIRELTTTPELSETEAWALVSRACSNGIYGYQQEFDKLPPPVQEAIGRPEQLREWALMDADTVNSVVASNFMRGYKVAVQRTKEREMLPPSVRQALCGFGMAQLPEKKE